MSDYWLIVGDRTIPIDPTGSMLVGYRSKNQAFTHIPVNEILNGSIPKTQLNGKIAFVGTSAAGLKDFQTTPIDPLFAAIAFHATVVDNILANDFRYRSRIATGIEMIVAIGIGILFVIANINAKASTSLLLILAGAAGLVSASFILFYQARIFFSPILPLALLIANFSTINLLRFWKAEKKARRSVHNLSLAQAAIIESMAAMTETRDSDTGGHIQRTREYVRLLASELRHDPQYGRLLTDEHVALLYRSAPLHDIGKVGISDSILRKRGQLSVDEFEEMKRHTIIGRNIITATNHTLGPGSFLNIAHEIIYTHHEKWDGTGYPQGLKGDQIPLSGRLMALADTYDALISERIYKPAFSHYLAVATIKRESGISFDPILVAAFLRVADDFLEIAQTYADKPSAPASEETTAADGCRGECDDKKKRDKSML